ncbi:hypothetical protein [Paenibacillus massiliensis]|uniref:hypothetical protein n=1 Tax=Paenibacillus massiliensis TaxID=225917 RepID=UPI0006851AB2|nr:hypothetical protein [Paenibacillus massiliensis]
MGNKMTPEIAAVLKKNGLSYDTYLGRLSRGWKPERAMTEPTKTQVLDKWRGQKEVAEAHSISYSTFMRRIKSGMAPEEAATAPKKANFIQDRKKSQDERGKYKKNSRRNIYIACEEMDFTWDPAEVREFERMWKSGVSVKEMGVHFNRDPDEVLVLAVDRMQHGTIQKRPRGALGVMA